MQFSATISKFQDLPNIYATVTPSTSREEYIYIEKPHIFSKRLNENHRRRCIYHVPSIVPLFQKNQKIPKKCVNSLNVKRSASQVSNIILGTCMKFKNYPMKIVDVFFGHYILYHCFKNFKSRQKYKKIV